MRNAFPAVLSEGQGQLLTTGEAARLMGTSRQHIVDLCNDGSLAYQLIGKHRRIRRADLDAFQSGSSRLTRDQLRSLWLSYAVAGRLVEDPVGVLELARKTVRRLLGSATRGSGRVWLMQWELLLTRPIDEILEALTSRSPRSRELRQNTPFAGVISEDQRQLVLANLTLSHRKDHPP